MAVKGLQRTYLMQVKMLFLGSLLVQTSPILDNTLLMKADLVNTVPDIACFGIVDNGLGLETEKNIGFSYIFFF